MPQLEMPCTTARPFDGAAAQIVVPTARQLAAAADLLARSLGFEPRDAIPAWLMRTTDGCGGLTLAALDHGDVVGVSYALPASDERRLAWFSCGLAVAPTSRGRGIARSLKLEQRRRALAAGVELIRWTADARNGPALRLYLSVLGARLVGYRPGRHRELRAAEAADDDVDVEWRLTGAEPSLSAPPAATIPFPADHGTAQHGAYARALREALDDGLVGVALEPDAGGRLRLVMAGR